MSFPPVLLSRRIWLVLGPLAFVILAIGLAVAPPSPSIEGLKIVPIKAKLVDKATLCAVVDKGEFVKFAKISSSKWVRIEVVKPNPMGFPFSQLQFIKLKICKTPSECRSITTTLTIVKPGTYIIEVSHESPFSESLEICIRFNTVG